MKNKIRVSLVAVGVAAAGVLFQTSPAFAGYPSTTVSVKTTDSGQVGATAIVWGDFENAANPADRSRERLAACDKQSDGLRAYAEAQWKVDGQWQFYSIEDSDGAGNGCHEVWLPNVTENQKIYIKACLKDGPNGVQRYCGTGSAVA